MYDKLRVAMRREHVTQRNIAELLGVHYNTVYAKLNQRQTNDFTVSDAALIHSTWFRDYDFAELFYVAPLSGSKTKSG